MYSIIYVKPFEKPEKQRFRRELRYADSMISCRPSVWKDLKSYTRGHTKIPIIANKAVGVTIFIEQIKDLDAIEKSVYDLENATDLP
tara:strand:- start:322 stop:582 length:261 start_codon:yes stop_codon:yes gene_type:complete